MNYHNSIITTTEALITPKQIISAATIYLGFYALKRGMKMIVAPENRLWTKTKDVASELFAMTKLFVGKITSDLAEMLSSTASNLPPPILGSICGVSLATLYIIVERKS